MFKVNAIRGHMPVVDARGNRLGTVDGLEGGDEIKLARRDSPDGVHHYIPLAWVAEVDEQVHLKKTTAEVLRGRH